MINVMEMELNLVFGFGLNNMLELNIELDL